MKEYISLAKVLTSKSSPHTGPAASQAHSHQSAL
eukprot:CAMPEP_0198458278 /NCGR_PEP_ID=MMETSP1453-20131121/34597_1 /TAXON_ID=1461543 ORGANISM="Unidentified sp., Strain RCC701" /NCGR_SAMPLE_ID=MMETSP1453 /ASSEMBLY_ACC=CAM_ASM_001118 /LENGTH=33 /DNA_ID= /DNA_START= /DNA_END= /DNA_ORIENTATION=